jgi:prolyl-tRNA synthetase
MTRLHAPTLKEDPNDAEVISHKLLVRGGYIRKLAAGIYDYLPLAQKVLQKIKGIIREELDRAHAQEVLLPAVQPAEIWEESGRWAFYGPELLRMKDRKGGDFCMGPTHEEVIVDLVRRDVRSWRSLPLNMYQIQTKFRDEIRPRAGLMRGREFIMKDAYSFDVDDDAANESYDAMFDAYGRIFARCGLDFRPVEADTGAIGGSRSHEFQVLADSGEDAIVSCSACNYAANIEQAEIQRPEALSGQGGALEKVDTPDVRTIEEVGAFLKRPATEFIKTLIIQTEEKVCAVLVRGDHELNPIKLAKRLGVPAADMATDAVVKTVTGAPVGFAGPIGLDEEIEVYADYAVQGMHDAIVGGNQVDTHYVGASEGRDFKVTTFADLRLAGAGDACGRCGSAFRSYRGIEVGHVFFLGTKYSEAMRCNYLDESGREQPMVMGCYGIGVSRIMAAAIEQNHDDNGIVWPKSLAPYQVSILPLQMNKEPVVEAAEKLYAELREAGVEVLLDDRKERAGSKFKDAELIGIPLRIVIGSRGLEGGALEIKSRSGGEAAEVPVDEVVPWVLEYLK